MRVRFTETAEMEIDQAWSWYEERSKGLGSRLLEDIIVARDFISQLPHASHPIGEGVRRCRLRRFPYGLVYLIHDDEAIVVGLGHLHRGPEYWRSIRQRRG